MLAATRIMAWHVQIWPSDRFVSLVCVYSQGGLPLYMKNFNVLNWFLGHLEQQKLEVENDPYWPPLRKWKIQLYFLIFSTPSLLHNLDFIRYDFSCIQKDWDWAACNACLLPNTMFNYVDIQARGLCLRTEFDTIYQVLNDDSGYIMFKGNKHTTITYDPILKKWTMARMNKPEVYAERGEIRT